jgi:succinate-semialdehyde dehydrogenase/glutarate-semialdehyde dehydrogenase
MMESYQLLLNGQWHDSDHKLSVINPASGQPFAQVATVDRSGVSQAIDDAAAAFELWKATTAQARGAFLRAVAAEMKERNELLAELISRENGKPLVQARGEVAMSIDHLLWFAEEGRRAYGRVVPPQAEGKRHLVIRQPVGVVGAIAPWNFPLVLAIRKIAPALAAGCTVILKPASATPLSACELARCIDAAGLPKGVFQLVVGSASEIGAEMLANPICRKISFTGSTEVGRTLIRGAADTCTELSLELGGNAPVIIFEDADLDLAVEGILVTKFRNNGQSCIAANRIYIHENVHDRLVEILTDRIKGLKVGDGLADGVDVGPLIDQNALDSALGFVDEAVEAGARLLAGGTRFGETGNFLAPTLLTDIPEHVRCRQLEIFAPIAALYRFRDEEEVLRTANDTEYGLAAYAFTSDLNRAMRVAEALEAGTVGINDPVPPTSNCPFGGFKQSGWGRELGSEGIDAYLETKHISFGGVG